MTITRRTFVAAAFGLLVPRINLRPAIDREALLVQFASQPPWYNYIYDLAKPFDYHGLAYATDAIIMCRTQLVAAEHDGEARLPNVIEAWEEFAMPAAPWRVEGLPPIAELTAGENQCTCPACNNRRMGLGEEYPEERDILKGGKYDLLDYDADDNTIRDKTCRLCHGKTYNGPSCAEFCGVAVKYSDARKMFSLPGVQFAPSKKPYTLCFRADEFEGVVCGLQE